MVIQAFKIESRYDLSRQFHPGGTLDLPSFLWLWRIAAWSMGLSLLAYGLLALTGFWIAQERQQQQPLPWWLHPLHHGMGWIMVGLILLLLAIGVVGTLGHYGTLGHSGHLLAGLVVVGLVLLSAGSATRIHSGGVGARSLHIATNLILFFGLAWAALTGWHVVQKYLP